MVTVDRGERDTGWERPARHRVSGGLRRFHLGSLDDDVRLGESVVLAAVIEVEVRRDDHCDVIDRDAVAVQSLVEIVVDRRVELVDEGVPDADARVDQDRAARMQHEVGETGNVGRVHGRCGAGVTSVR